MAWRGGGWGASQARPSGAWGSGGVRPSGAWSAGQKGAGKTAAAGVAKSLGAQSDTYVVRTTGKDTDEVVVRTLVGEYVASGENHNRKVYKKVPEKGGEIVDVFMYYWDGRDGPAFEGWWFGNKLGGTQVWSHCTVAAMTPPPTGWKIPWDGTVRPTLIVESKAAASQHAASDRFSTLSGEVNEAGTSAKAALEQAKAAAGDYLSSEGIKSAEQLLSAQVPLLNEALKKLMESARGQTGEAAKQITQLGTSLRATQNSISAELAKLRASKAKAEGMEKVKAAEERDQALWQEVLPEATNKTNAAEDSVEKAVITNEMISAAGDDLEEQKQAVGQVEAACQEAQKSIGEARIFLNTKMAAVKRFETTKVKALATTELGKLNTLLQEAQGKLAPLKTVRQDFVQRTAAQKVVQEIIEKLSPAEVDVDRAEEATITLQTSEGGDAAKEAMKQAETAVNKAGEHVNAVMAFISQKKRSATGLARDEIVKMEERARTSQTRLQELKTSHKEAAEKATCTTLLAEASDKLQDVIKKVSEACDAESPFLMGVEELPLNETLNALQNCEKLATAANTAVSIARMFIATKMVEAKRFTPGPSQEAQSKLKELQGELEVHTKKLAELKKQTGARKRVATMREAEREVQKAEELAKAVGEAAAIFQDDAKLFELSSTEIRAASDETLKAEQAANAALAEARKNITAKQIEAKGKDMSAEVSQELIKYQSRLSCAQAEVVKSKKLCGGVETRLQAKKHIEEARGKLEVARQKVDKVVDLVEALGEEPQEGDAKETKAEDGEGEDKEVKEEKEEKEAESVSPIKAAEKASSEAQVCMKTTARYLESKGRDPSMRDEVARLQPDLKKLQEKLDAALSTMQVKSEKITVDALIKESRDRVGECESLVEEVANLEKPFAESSDSLPVEEATAALDKLESAVQAAHTAAGGTKTFLAMKRLAAKRLSEASAKASTEELASLQTRLDTATKRLVETKKGMNERKFVTVKREVAAKVAGAERRVEEAVEATKALADNPDLVPEEMKTCCEKAGLAQNAAHTDIQAARTLLASRQSEAKKTVSADSEVVTELTKMLEKLQKAQSELEKQKGILRDQEHKFVARRLLKDATEMIEQLEAKMKEAVELAGPLTSDKAEDLLAGVHLQHAVACLKGYARRAEKTTKAVFDELRGEQETFAEERFVSFALELPEAKSADDGGVSDEQLKAAYSCLKGKEQGVSETAFLEQFREKYVCLSGVSMTDSLKLKEGKTVRKLEVNEILEGLEVAINDETVNLMRVKARAEKDGKEGYVTLAGNQGTKYLEPYTPLAASQKRVEVRLKQLFDSTREAAKYIEQKCEELKSVRTGPLADTKTELLNMRPKVAKVKLEQEELRKKVASVQKKQKECLEAEKKRRREAQEREKADASLAEVERLVAACQEKVDQAVPAAQSLAASRGGGEEDPVAAMTKAEKDLESCLQAVDETMSKIKAHMEEMKAATRGPLSEARSALVKLKVKVGSLEPKCKTQQQALQRARKQAASDASAAVAAALRAHARKEGLRADDLLKQLAPGEQEVSAAALRGFIEKIPEHGLKAAQLDLGLERFAAGVSRLALLDLLQEFNKCVKETAITTAFEVKDSKTIRKLAVGEIVELLEGDRTDAGTGLARVRCRAVLDLKEGWATLRGNQGTAYVSRVSKPYYCCQEETTLQTAFASSDPGQSEVKKLQQGEVLELLEGPQKEPNIEVQRVRIRTKKDGKSGWATQMDPQGAALLEPSKLLVCKQSIAITTDFDIAAGKAIRKLDVGETLEVLEGPRDDEKRSLTRFRARAGQDGKEGWVTMKGNQGTSYTEESDRLRVCRQSLPLEARLSCGSSLVRTLEQGEVVEVTDGPKSDTQEGASRLRGRSLIDGAEGWLTVSASNVQRWSLRHKCAQQTVLNDKLDIKEAKTIRKLEPGEMVEALAPPEPEKVAGVLRVRVRTEKDGAVGYATVSGNRGTVLLKPVPDDE